MLRKMVIPEERIEEEEYENSDDTDSIGGISESSSDSDMLSTDSGILSPGILSPDIPPSPAHTRSYGKDKKTKGR